MFGLRLSAASGPADTPRRRANQMIGARGMGLGSLSESTFAANEPTGFALGRARIPKDHWLREAQSLKEERRLLRRRS